MGKVHFRFFDFLSSFSHQLCFIRIILDSLICFLFSLPLFMTDLHLLPTLMLKGFSSCASYCLNQIGTKHYKSVLFLTNIINYLNQTYVKCSWSLSTHSYLHIFMYRELVSDRNKQCLGFEWQTDTNKTSQVLFS